MRVEGKKLISSHQLQDMICADYGIDQDVKECRKFEDFPIKDGKRRINALYNSVIVDRDGKEHPYMLYTSTRNNQKLVDFDHIYHIRTKYLTDVCAEAGISLKAESCRICEGGGWSSAGTRLFYKEFYCEI